MDLEDFEKHIIPKIEAGRTVETVRQIIKTGQYAEQDRRESLKETFKPITNELEKVDEGIDELKDELKKDLKAIGEPLAAPAASAAAASAIEGPPQVAITDKDYVSIEEQESLMNRGYPDIREMIDNPDLREKILKRLAKESKFLGGKKRTAEGNNKKDIEKKLRANTNYRKLIRSLPNPQKGSGVFYYNSPRDLFERLELLGGSIRAGNNSVKNEFSEVAHTLYKLGVFPSEVLNGLLRKFLSV